MPVSALSRSLRLRDNATARRSVEHNLLGSPYPPLPSRGLFSTYFQLSKGYLPHGHTSPSIHHGRIASCGAETVVHRLIPPYHELDAKKGRTSATLLTQDQGPLAILQDSRERHCETVSISWRHEQACPPIIYHLLNATRPCSNHRSTQAHRLEGREAKGFGQARQHHH